VAAHTESGSVRIIGGKWRSRIIGFDDAEGLRPTTARIRETVFNWLQPYIHQSRCLDLFAGSGVLGFEALSRGARELVFIEQNKKTSTRLRDNITRLQAENVTVYNQDALAWLQSAQAEQHCVESFDLVFLDPPFHAGLLTESCMLLNNSGCLAEDAIIYTEHNAGADIEVPENWLALKEKTAGQVVYRLFENRPDSDS
jgi:16S rRNA (guanine966-N2)-methyltransferase